ncbi:MAG: glycosyltransferase [Armatimonadetes bacterium]|nr:glycosyltransferase [Armatimonadota bacterium]
MESNASMFSERTLQQGLRVAIFSECYRPTRNGVVSSVETFREHLSKLGCHVKVFAPSYPGYDETDEDVHRFPSFCFTTYVEYPIAIPLAIEPWRKLGQFAPHIVHVHSVFWLTRFAGYWAKRRRIPLVLTYHTLVTEYLHYVPLPKTLARMLAIKLSKDFCNMCDLVIVPSPAVIPILRSYGVKTEIVPLPTGVEIESFQGGDGASIRKQYGIPQDAIVLLYAGRIGLEKNIEFLLKATSIVLREYENTYLLLVGPGPYLSRAMRTASSLNCSHRIIFAGGHPRERMRDFYASADVFVSASLTETQGLSIAEAMAAGLPCVAINAHGVSWAFEDGVHGFLSPNDKRAFAERVRWLISNRALRKRMGDAARKHVEENLSPSSIAMRLLQLYRSLLCERQTQPPVHLLSS